MIESYEDVGRRTYLSGAPCVPIYNETVRVAVKTMPGTARRVVRDFIHGWDAAQRADARPVVVCRKHLVLLWKCGCSRENVR